MRKAGFKKLLTLDQAKARYQKFIDGNASFPKPSFDWWWYMEEVDLAADDHIQFEDWVAIRASQEIPVRKSENQELNSVAAFQVGNYRIEYANPDFAFAYASLIPDVAAAAAYLDCGEIEKAKKALTLATRSIDLFRQFNGLFALHAEKE